jgi:hypothetical protein
MKIVSADEAKRMGFADYNNNDHLIVDVPDKNFTISARTSEGRKITFAFLQYKDDSPPQCVDVMRHESPLKIKWNNGTLDTQAVIGFGPSGHVGDIHIKPTDGYSMFTFLIGSETDDRYTKVGVVNPEKFHGVSVKHRKRRFHKRIKKGETTT